MFSSKRDVECYTYHNTGHYANEYKQGKAYGNADALSRLTVAEIEEEETTTPEDDEI